MNLQFSIENKIGNFKLSVKLELDGNRIGLFGPSGSGKSTFAGLVSGLQTPDSGEIILNDKILFSSIRKINLLPEKRRIGIVFQGAYLFPHLSVRKNLLYGWKRIPAEKQNINFDQLADTLGLNHLLDREVHNLSGGEKQRVAIGRTILSNPELIILDEPLTGLDFTMKARIMDYMKSVFAEFKIPYIFISHSIKEMRIMTEKTAYIEEGKIISVKETEKLARDLLGKNRMGYLNLLTLKNPRPHGVLWKYSWGNVDLVLTEKGTEDKERMFELSSNDITLFKGKPTATSARNVLESLITDVFEVNNRVGVVLDIQGQTLISQIVRESAEELEIRKGETVYAIIKATGFRPA